MAHVARNIEDYLRIVDRHATDAGRPLWFRGLGRHTFRLVPSLFRHRNRAARAGDIDHLLSMERTLIDRFRERSLPFRDTFLPESDLELLFVMQHFGVPTRLLDWSENALVALWFAVEDPLHDLRRGRVWLLDPFALNQAVLSDSGYDGGALAPGAAALGGHTPSKQLEEMNQYPLAVYGIHSTPRIVGQRGVFTIAGKALRPAEELVTQLAPRITRPCTALLSAVDIPANTKPRMRQQLENMGMTRSMIFPDLIGIARELTDTYCEVL